jgi:[ribosomal protein S5]-alanine N-acetyltransferase
VPYVGTKDVVCQKNQTHYRLTPLELTTCRLRPWRDSDEDSLTQQANNRHIWNNVRDFFPSPYTTRDAISWIRGNKGFANPNNFAIEVGGRAIGNVGFTVKDDVYRYNAEVGYWIGEAYWGRGIISEVMPVMVRYIFQNFQVNRLYACVLDGNPASMRVLEKAKFRHEATLKKAIVKNNQYLDEHLFAILREEFLGLVIL